MIELTDTTFELKEGLMLVLFWAPWCDPCLELKPVIEQLSIEGLDVYSINTDQNPLLTVRFQIKGVPTTLLFKDGVIMENIAGSVPLKVILPFIQRHIK